MEINNMVRKNFNANPQIKMAEETFLRFYRYLGEIKKIKNIKGVSAYEGMCFFIESKFGRRYVLKFSKNFKTYRELNYLFRATREARKRGFIEIPDIIITDKKEAGAVESDSMSFVLYEFKKGKTMKGFDYGKMGKFLADFHNALFEFKLRDPRAKRKKTINIKKQIAILNKALHIGNINSADYDYILKQIKCFQKNFTEIDCKFKKGVVHGDFNDRNILSKNSKFTGLIDLDDLHEDIRILDFSKAILHEPTTEDLVNFVKEYQGHISVKLDKNEISFLPEIWRFRLIKMLIWAVNSPWEKTVRKPEKKDKQRLKKAVEKDYGTWMKMLKNFDDFDWNRFCRELGVRKPGIIATIGRASDTEEMMVKMALAGMDIARLNFSYDTHAKHEEVLNNLREVEKKLSKHLLILQDLGGAKLRTGDIENGETKLISGQKLILTTRKITGNVNEMSVNYSTLPKDVRLGVKVFLEGKKHLIELKVVSIKGKEIETKIINGGEVRRRKGLHIPGAKLSVPALTGEDRKDLEFGIKNKVDYVALSFVQSAEVIKKVKKILQKSKVPQIKVIAKVENMAGIKNIGEIIKAADVIMVARGDLQFEVPSGKLPLFQKIIVDKCKKAGKEVIVATRFLESMIEGERPKKSEIKDIELAVSQGSDYLLLSPETAKGKNPVETVALMRKTIQSVS